MLCTDNRKSFSVRVAHVNVISIIIAECYAQVRENHTGAGGGGDGGDGVKRGAGEQ